jgi:hypothetical protein
MYLRLYVCTDIPMYVHFNTNITHIDTNNFHVYILLEFIESDCNERPW